jgi:hypothetical protein
MVMATVRSNLRAESRTFKGISQHYLHGISRVRARLMLSRAHGSNGVSIPCRLSRPEEGERAACDLDDACSDPSKLKQVHHVVIWTTCSNPTAKPPSYDAHGRPQGTKQRVERVSRPSVLNMSTRHASRDTMVSRQ